MIIAYILGEFPSHSEYFILNEIVGLKGRGFDIEILSLNKGPILKDSIKEVDLNKVKFNNSFFSLSKIIAHFYMLYSLRNKYFKVLCEVLLSSKFLITTLFKGIRNFSTSVYFLYQIRNIKVEHIHAHFISLPADIAVVMSKLLNIPFSCSAHAHDIYTSDKRELIRKIDLSKFIITCTLLNKIYLERFLKQKNTDKVIHIYHGIDLTKWILNESSFNLSKTNEIHILTVGRLVEKKGIIYLLKAVRMLIDYGYSIKCTVVGDGPLKQTFINYIINNNLTASINLCGALDQASIKQIFRKTDFFILPCIIASNGDRDGLPNVLLEALATGVPTISTAVSAIPELLIPGQTGIIVPEKCPRSIMEAIIELWENPSMRKYLSMNGRKKVEQEFNIETSTNYLADRFNSKQIINNRTATSNSIPFS